MMTDKQAKQFAASIFVGIKAYISAHREDFEAWQREQEVNER